MFCNQCGKKIPDDSNYCPACGKKLDYNIKKQTDIQSSSSFRKGRELLGSHQDTQGKEKESNLKKHWPAILAVGSICLCILIIILGANGSKSKNQNHLSSNSTTSTSTATKAPTVTYKPVATEDPDRFLIKAPFYNGMLVKTPAYKCVCPLSVSVKGEKKYYIYLKYVSAPVRVSYESRETDYGNGSGSDIAFLVSAGSTAEVLVPIGRYKLYYAAGDNWYGDKYKFGSSTQYSSSNDLLDFYADSEYYQGHSLELWLQANGNLDSYQIDESNFPG